MNPARTIVRLALVGGLLAWGPLEETPRAAGRAATVEYPDGFRNWAHVKSSLITPAHKTFGQVAGFQHIYANSAAMIGYRTRMFPEGSVVAFEWLRMTEFNGAFLEGPRIQLDVMLKDSLRFASTGGWGFQRFVGESRTERAETPKPQQCFQCHDQRKQDGLVLSRYRQ